MRSTRKEGKVNEEDRGQRKEKGLDCARIFEDILPRGKTDIVLINNACLRPSG